MSIKLLFSCGPFSNLEIDGINSIQEAKAKYDECVHYFGAPKEAPKGGGGGYKKTPPEMSGNICKDCGAPMQWKKDKSKDYCSKLCWQNKAPQQAPPANPANVAPTEQLPFLNSPQG